MNWAPGDLAECIDVRDLRLPYRRTVAMGGRFLTRGMVYIVQGIVDVGPDILHLDVGVPSGSKLACRFRKVPPLGEEEVRELEEVGSREAAKARGGCGAPQASVALMCRATRPAAHYQAASPPARPLRTFAASREQSLSVRAASR